MHDNPPGQSNEDLHCWQISVCIMQENDMRKKNGGTTLPHIGQ